MGSACSARTWNSGRRSQSSTSAIDASLRIAAQVHTLREIVDRFKFD